MRSGNVKELNFAADWVHTYGNTLASSMKSRKKRKDFSGVRCVSDNQQTITKPDSLKLRRKTFDAKVPSLQSDL